MTPLNDPLTIDWLIELWFYDTKYFISETFPQANILAWYGKTKPNTTKARIHQSKGVGVPGAVWASCPWTKHVSDRLAIFTPPPIGEWSIVMSVSVCLSVCLSVRDHIFGTTRPIFAKCFVHFTYGRGSVLLWRRSDTLCTAGFMDDVIFAHTPRLLDVAAQLKRCKRSLGLDKNCAQ